MPKVKSALQLAPPQNVQQIKQSEEHKIIWEASSDEKKPGFAGYNVYFSNKSLIFTAIKNLPVPVELDKTVHECIPDDIDSLTFLHVRSRNTRGEISLPSLPEIKFKSVE